MPAGMFTVGRGAHTEPEQRHSGEHLALSRVAVASHDRDTTSLHGQEKVLEAFSNRSHSITCEYNSKILHKY